uniref:Uncharacterized protein n=1 Tax=Cannabis sativa TaxID=3483 RepID=A0A803QYE4_CANSA
MIIYFESHLSQQSFQVQISAQLAAAAAAVVVAEIEPKFANSKPEYDHLEKDRVPNPEHVDFPHLVP